LTQVLENRSRSREREEAIEQITALGIEKYCTRVKISVVLVVITRMIFRFPGLDNRRESSQPQALATIEIALIHQGKIQRSPYAGCAEVALHSALQPPQG